MTDDGAKLTRTGETRREYLTRKQRERRARLTAAGLPPPKSGPSGPSGGASTVTERVRPSGVSVRPLSSIPRTNLRGRSDAVRKIACPRCGVGHLLVEENDSGFVHICSSCQTEKNETFERLAEMLAEIIDSTLMTVQDEDGHEVEVRIGGFKPDLGNRAAALLKEIGY